MLPIFSSSPFYTFSASTKLDSWIYKYSHNFLLIAVFFNNLSLMAKIVLIMTFDKMIFKLLGFFFVKLIHMCNMLCYFSHIWLFVTPWTAARQASLSITNSWRPPKPMSIESVMLFNHPILCHPLLLLPSIFPSIRVFSNESALHIRCSVTCNSWQPHGP